MNNTIAPSPSPFLATSSPDDGLVEKVRAGDRDATEALLTQHLDWIFNLSFRMLHRRADADDATQEILMKMVKALPAFRAESKFRTWAYRIAAHHLLNVKKGPWAAEDPICSLSRASAGLRQVPDLELPDPRTVPVPVEILIRETAVNCTIGTLLCLEGRQRLAFILGEVFGVSDEVGAEIVEVSPANFRQILCRARRDLYQYLRGNCSLVNPGAECKCARKTRSFIQAGFVHPQKLEFTAERTRKVKDMAPHRADMLMEAYLEAGASVYRNHPFFESGEQAAMLRKVLNLDVLRQD